ncbi:MAG: UDP-N-acetylglucosamine 1-carboxyvinyltransferase [Planctomycetes bacterium]|nr:UDP-N-acetylglucosamine 1-carboxyvinyltransferase [Planctomycetota bacterium]
MDKYVIQGGARLVGRVRIAGAKNAALPILAATLMTDQECVVEGVPELQDTATMLEVLRSLGMEVSREGSAVRTRLVNEDLSTAHYDLLSTMRAGFCVLGPLVARRKRARVSMPGGCNIGPRPVDIHLRGLTRLGASLVVEHGYVAAEADRLVGAEMFLGGAQGSTVLGTANILMAATLARGTTVLEGVAIEPEVQDLARFLVCMGAHIDGIGTHRLEVEGVEALEGTRYRIIPDRIEAGTFLVAAAITRGDVEVENTQPEHLTAVLEFLRERGVTVEKSRAEMKIRARVERELVPGDVFALPYPGIPTDMQAQLMALLCTIEGTSTVHDKVFPDRFIHAGEFIRMGARIAKENGSATVQGGPPLSGAQVQASDLRAGAALVLAGLAASGTTELSRVYHLDRGYVRFESKLAALGARIQRARA